MVAKTTIDIYSRGKTKTLYCNKNDTVIAFSNHGNVAIVYGKNGLFSVLTEHLKEITMDALRLIKSIKYVDAKMAYGFPVDYVREITEGKDWEEEFKEKLKASDIRESLKTKILESYEK